MQFCDVDNCRGTCRQPELLQKLDKYLRILVAGKPINEDDIDWVEQFYQKIKRTVSGLVITDKKEKLSIVEATGMSLRHCFKCPNGELSYISV